MRLNDGKRDVISNFQLKLARVLHNWEIAHTEPPFKLMETTYLTKMEMFPIAFPNTVLTKMVNIILQVCYTHRCLLRSMVQYCINFPFWHLLCLLYSASVCESA